MIRRTAQILFRQPAFMKAASTTVALPVLLGLLASSTGCKKEVATTEEILPSVAAVEVAAVDLDDEIRASGDLRARFQTMISSEVAGRVTELSVDEGGQVAEGAVVIKIDPERRRLDLSAAKARLAQARANLRQETSKVERVRKLRSENIASVDPSRARVWAVSPRPLAPASPPGPRIVSIDFPIGKPEKEQCGRAVHIDAHVHQPKDGDRVGPDYPRTCGQTMSTSEAALAFFLFHLADCVVPPPARPGVPPTR